MEQTIKEKMSYLLSVQVVKLESFVALVVAGVLVEVALLRTTLVVEAGDTVGPGLGQVAKPRVGGAGPQLAKDVRPG